MKKLVCQCAHVRVDACALVSVCACVRVCVSVRLSVCACVRMSVHACAYDGVCVCVLCARRAVLGICFDNKSLENTKVALYREKSFVRKGLIQNNACYRHME